MDTACSGSCSFVAGVRGGVSGERSRAAGARPTVAPTTLQVDRGHPRLVVALAGYCRQLGLYSPQVLVGQLHVDGGGVLLEIASAFGAGDRDEVLALGKHPGQ